jgi:phage baseplate assembly protein W
MSGISVKLPLSIDDTDGAYALNKTFIALVRQNLKMVLLTNPGERIMDKDFGVGLSHSLFEQNVETEYIYIKDKIEEQVGKYLSYIAIENIDIQSIEEGNGIHITLAYRIIPLNAYDLLNLAFDEK